MILDSLGKVWLALLLLCAALSSAPLGSMEQRAPAMIGQLGYAASVPAARPSGAMQMYGVLPGANRPDLSRAPPGAAAPCSPIDSPPVAGDRVLHSARRTDADAARPLCECLPYHANAPPAAT